MIVQSMGEIGKDFGPNFLQPILETIDRRSCNDGNRELIPVFQLTPSPKMPTLCFGGESHLGRFEQEEGKTSSDQYPKGP